MPYGGSLTTIAKMRGSQSIETYATVSTTEKQQQLCFIYFGTGVAESSGELPQSTIENYTFLERPSRSDFEMSYPVSALISHRPGDVILICTVASDGKLDCRVGYEAGPGWGFGQAALRVAQKFRLPPQTSDGRSTTGATIRLPITFRAG
jgi:TonB family protein